MNNKIYFDEFPGFQYISVSGERYEYYCTTYDDVPITPADEALEDTNKCKDLVSFQSRWNVGSDRLIRLPIDISENSDYDCLINWGDGNTTLLDNIEKTNNFVSHTYNKMGQYNITITGKCKGLNFYGAADADKIIDIGSIGDVEIWTSKQFYGCSNLRRIEGTPLITTDSFEDMFTNCLNLNSNLNDWDVADVTNFARAFNNCKKFNGKLLNWDTGSANNMEAMFLNAEVFNQSINHFDMINVENISYMFKNASLFNQPLNNWNTQCIQYMNGTFENAHSFNQSLANWNISSMSTAINMLKNSAFNNINYAAILYNWVNQPVQLNVQFHSGNAKFSSARNIVDARDFLINQKGWRITDLGSE